MCKTLILLFLKIFFGCVKILRATKYHVAGHIWPAGREFVMPGVEYLDIDTTKVSRYSKV